jgi:farnesyl diphosphate synthase
MAARRHGSPPLAEGGGAGHAAHKPGGGNLIFDLREWSSERLDRVEQALMDWVPADTPARLGEAMRYAVLDGGKRLRPLLVLGAAEAVDGHAEAALRAGCAVELIHAYSLVHDDMPCMDNDVLRRGKPTVHVAFGEATALLAGDALQALAFELLTPEGAGIPDRTQSGLCRLLAQAAGHAGMAGGQAIDLAAVGKSLNETELRQMHRLKTGALLQASVMMGAACGETSASARHGLEGYGRALGLAFQVVDDILDVTADSATLGKTAGKDAAQDKPTYVSLLGLQRARAYAAELLEEARAALATTGLADTQALLALAEMVVHREN